MDKPKIRIGGFNEEWIRKPLRELSEPLKYGLNAAAIPFDGINKYIRITDIDDSTHEYQSSNISSPNVNVLLCQEYILNEQDIVFARTGASVGKSYLYRHKDGKVFFAGFLIRARILKEYNPEFVFQYSLTKDFKDFIRITSQRSGQPGVNSKEYGDYNLKIPSTSSEQQAIADFFKSLDSMITLTSKKIDKLKQALMGCMQTMFPQEGEFEPKIRFKGFEGEWEKVKFSELYEPSSIKNKTYGPEKIISVANMYFKPVSYISNDDYLKSYNVMNLGDIAFEGNKSKNYAHGRFVENFIGNGIVSHVFIVLKPKSKQYDLQFWRYLINYEGIMGPILLRSTKHSTMMTDLVVGDFLKENILVPSYTEQKEIGAYFNNLDTLIALQTKRLDLLKHIKSACLDNMFV